MLYSFIVIIIVDISCYNKLLRPRISQLTVITKQRTLRNITLPRLLAANPSLFPQKNATITPGEETGRTIFRVITNLLTPHQSGTLSQSHSLPSAWFWIEANVGKVVTRSGSSVQKPCTWSAISPRYLDRRGLSVVHINATTSLPSFAFSLAQRKFAGITDLPRRATEHCFTMETFYCSKQPWQSLSFVCSTCFFFFDEFFEILREGSFIFFKSFNEIL